jgi:hypothetical protein
MRRPRPLGAPPAGFIPLKIERSPMKSNVRSIINEMA